MKKLPDLRNRNRDLWDASRIVDPGLEQSFVLSDLKAGQPLHLIFRVAPSGPSQIRVAIDGKRAGDLAFPISDDWEEVSLIVPAQRVTSLIHVLLTTTSLSAAEIFHLWAVQGNE